MTGCQSEPAPTGEALYADAEKTYFEYREFVNGVQSVIASGPWGLGQYGMQPSRCDDNTGYEFDLGRTLQIDVAQRQMHVDAVVKHLEDAGMSPSYGTLGSGGRKLIQFLVSDEGGFDKLLLTFDYDGRVVLSATTACRPGDAFALSDMIFGEEHTLTGYLPSDAEAPTDPLFFGITPGDPQFVRETPAP